MINQQGERGDSKISINDIIKKFYTTSQKTEQNKSWTNLKVKKKYASFWIEILDGKIQVTLKISKNEKFI